MINEVVDVSGFRTSSQPNRGVQRTATRASAAHVR